MKSEMDAYQKNKTWELVSKHSSFNVIGYQWVYKVKKHVDGTIAKYKVKLVAKGFNQREGVDFFDTFNLVVKPTTIHLVLTIAFC